MLLIAIALALVLGWPRVRAMYSSDAVALQDLVVATVRRGSLLRDVRAPGTLVPTDLRWIASNVEGRVESIEAQAGQEVLAGTVIMRLSNPTLTRNVDAARLELEVLESQAEVLEKRLASDLLAQQALVAEIASQYENARFRLEAYRALGEAMARLDVQEWTLQERQYGVKLDIEQQRLDYLRELQSAELRASQAETRRARANLRLQEELLDGLTVRAGIDGVLQDVPVEEGQQLASGALLARVAREDNFKTELRVQESQVRDVLLGQKVGISAGGQQVSGRVQRIDPAVQNGVVLVDAVFSAEALPGARPDLRVQGVIEIGYVEDTLVLSRPVFSQENSSTELFVIDAQGGRAERSQVNLGLASVDSIEVLGGLKEGDRVIVSDVSRFAARESFALR